MQSNNLSNTEDINSKSCDNRRKRINRMKTAIVILVIVFMIVLIIFCVFLGMRVYRLQKQVDQLMSIHIQTELAGMESDNEKYAYAAEKEDIQLLPAIAVHDQEFIKNITPSEESQQEVENDKIADSEEITVNAVEEEKSEQRNESVGSVEVSGAENTKKKSEHLKKSDKELKEEAKKEIDSLGASRNASNNSGKYSDKTVYLTFDDGPSIYTDDILDILDQYGVKATFFVVGKTDSYSKKIYRRIVEDGHTLGMHSYSHQYSKIYNSVEDFEKDFTKLQNLLYDTTGYKPSIFRFPGGSDNMVNKHGMEDFIRYLNENGIVYFDWNVLNGDATGVAYTKRQMIDNVLSGLETKNISIVLMHDSQTKGVTVESLTELLEILQTEGAQLLPLDKDVTPIQMIKADTIK